MPDYQVKISAKSNHHALHNLSSNPTAKVTEFDKQLGTTFLGKAFLSYKLLHVFRAFGTLGYSLVCLNKLLLELYENLSVHTAQWKISYKSGISCQKSISQGFKNQSCHCLAKLNMGTMPKLI
jgi:hypothetical protein